MSVSPSSIPFDQRLARWLVQPLVSTPIHPNHLTALGLLVGLGAAGLLATGAPALMNWGGGLFVVAVFMDHTDGELARMAKKISKFGHYFDHVAALTTYVGGFVGIGIGLAHGPLGAIAIAMGVAAGIAIALIFGARVSYEMRGRDELVTQGNVAGFETEDILYVIGPVVWLGFAQPFLIAASVGAPLFLALTLWRASRGKSVTGGWRN